MGITWGIFYFTLGVRKLVHGNTLVRFSQGLLFMKKAIKAFTSLVFKNCIPLLPPFCHWFRGNIFYGQVNRIRLYYWVAVVYQVKSPLYLVLLKTSENIDTIIILHRQWENGGLDWLNNLPRISWLRHDGTEIWIKFSLISKPMLSATNIFLLLWQDLLFIGAIIILANIEQLHCARYYS